MGSGIIVNKDSGEEIRFTQIKEVNYERDVNNLCLNWAPSQPFQEGMYKVEIYNKGHLAGSSSFTLK